MRRLLFPFALVELCVLYALATTLDAARDKPWLVWQIFACLALWLILCVTVFFAGRRS